MKIVTVMYNTDKYIIDCHYSAKREKDKAIMHIFLVKFKTAIGDTKISPIAF